MLFPINQIKSKIYKYKNHLVALIALLSSQLTFAAYNIGAPTTGPFVAVSNFLQTTVDFLDGPGILALAVISIIGGIGLWVIAPKNSAALGWIFRIAVGLIVVLNLSVWVTYFVSL